MKRFIHIAFLSLILTLVSYSQDYKKQFNDLFNKNDSVGQRVLLQKWDAYNNQDPELYIAYFNYYINRSRQEVLRLDDLPKGSEYIKLVNIDTTQNLPVKYLSESMSYNPILVKKGFYYADKGLQIAPDRLDIRFGKAYVYSKMEDWNNFTQQIINTIDYGVTIENKWIWSDNKPLDEPKDFMLGTIQNYQNELYNTNNDDLLVYMKQIAEAVLKHYPNHVESLSNLSITYMLGKEYDKALEFLLKATNIAPKDYIVLSNIAHAYKMKGDKKNAIEYYKLVEKYGDIESTQYAKQQIDELGKK